MICIICVYIYTHTSFFNSSTFETSNLFKPLQTFPTFPTYCGHGVFGSVSTCLKSHEAKAPRSAQISVGHDLN